MHQRSAFSADACLEGNGDEHLGQFGSRSTSNFLYAQSQEVMLELSQLLGQIDLVPTERSNDASARKVN
jgi:hypothetical protein